MKERLVLAGVQEGVCIQHDSCPAKRLTICPRALELDKTSQGAWPRFGHILPEAIPAEHSRLAAVPCVPVQLRLVNQGLAFASSHLKSRQLLGGGS